MRSRSLVGLLAAAALTLTLAPAAPAGAKPPPPTESDLQVVPALKEWTAADEGDSFELGRRIVVAGSSDELTEVGRTFAADLAEVTDGRKLPVVPERGKVREGDIVLDLSDDAELGSEGYALTVDGSLHISAPEPHGIFNGTRSVLQLLTRADSIPAGTARDWPTKEVRSVLVDNTPRHFSLQWWESFFRQMSWYKMNDTNLYVDGTGLTKSEMKQIDELAQRYYVRVVPQLNMPGHMHTVLPSHPEYQLENADGTTDPVALDLTNEEAVEWALGLLDEYLDVFSGDTWHLGADEFPGWPGTDEGHPQLAEYAKEKFGPEATFWDLWADFENRALAVVKEHGKSMRVWNDMVRESDVVRLDPEVDVEYWIKHDELEGLLTAEEIADRGHQVINADVDLLYYDMSKRNLDPRDLYEQFDVNEISGGQPTDPEHVSGARIAAWLAWIDTPMESDAEVINNLRKPTAALAQHTWGDGAEKSWTEFSALVDELGLPPGFVESNNSITGDPAAVTNQDGTVAWFARDEDGVLWGGRQHDPASGPWSQQEIAHRVAGDPQVRIDAEARIHVVARTTDDRVVHAVQESPGSDEYRTRVSGNRVDGDPVPVSVGGEVGWAARAGDQLVVSDGARVRTVAEEVTGDPGAVSVGDTAHLVVSTESGTTHLWSTGGAWQQDTDDQELDSRPVLVNRGESAVAVARTADNDLVAGTLGETVDWTTVHEDVVGQPATVAATDGTVHAAVRTSSNDVVHARTTGSGWASEVAWYDFVDDPAIGLSGKDDVPTIMGQNDRGHLAAVQPGADGKPWQWTHLAESTTGTPAIAVDARDRPTYVVTTTYGDLQTGTQWGTINEWGRDFVVGSIAYPDDTLAPDALPERTHRDQFSRDSLADYEVLAPSTDPPAGEPEVTDGRLQVEGEHFTLLRSEAELSGSADNAVVLGIDEFAANDGPENSLHVGFVKDAKNRTMAWYNRETQRFGFDTVVDGKSHGGWGDVPMQLVPGDKIAVTLSGRWLTGYRFHEGRWDRIHTAPVNGPEDLADPDVRADYRAGFGLSSSGGTLAVDDFEVRTG